MKTFLILGAGTGGTMVANKMAEILHPQEWRIIIVDKEETHYYQPGFLFIPFGIYSPADVVKPKRNFLPPLVEVIFSDIELIEPDDNRVKLAQGKTINYDYLVVATGSHIHPEETPGLADDPGWHNNIFPFYDIEGATKLGNFLKFWKGGKLVLNVAEMPIKCPVAPLEFLFLADWFFHERGIRDNVDITFATPLPGAFTKPRASDILGDMLTDKNINLVADFNIMEVDQEKQVIRSYDEIEVPYDLLVTIPTNMGAEVIGDSGMGDDPHHHTLSGFYEPSRWTGDERGLRLRFRSREVPVPCTFLGSTPVLRTIRGAPPVLIRGPHDRGGVLCAFG